MSDQIVRIYTDGACSGNPGPGGWGAIILFDGGKFFEIGGRLNPTTNNQMEILAAKEAIDSLSPDSDWEIEVYTDSMFVINGITKWVHGWVKNGWKTKEGADVSNKKFWLELLATTKRKGLKRIHWNHVKGHAGNLLNERADEIAVGFSKTENFSIELKKGHLNLSALSNAKPFSSPKYISYVSGLFKVHDTWGECEQAVKGRAGAKFKKVKSDSELEKVKKSWGL